MGESPRHVGSAAVVKRTTAVASFSIAVERAVMLGPTEATKDVIP